MLKIIAIIFSTLIIILPKEIVAKEDIFYFKVTENIKINNNIREKADYDSEFNCDIGYDGNDNYIYENFNTNDDLRDYELKDIEKNISLKIFYDYSSDIVEYTINNSEYKEIGDLKFSLSPIIINDHENEIGYEYIKNELMSNPIQTSRKRYSFCRREIVYDPDGFPN